VRDLIELAGAIAGLAAFLGLAVLALLYFAQARDVRRLREWAGGAPERDAGLSEATSEVAAQRADELQRLEQERKRQEDARRAEERAAALREQRRERRERGLPEETRWERVRSRVGGGLPAARYLALIAGAVIVLGTGVAVLALGVLNDDANGGGGKGASLRPSDIEVAVLNGTALSGLAGRTGDQLERDGFELGAVTNSPSSFSTSVVMYTRGRKPEARRVGRDLSIRETRLMTDEVAAAAAGAPVAVVIGEDRAGAPET
jgi:hypothetical protein